ncbi:ribosomal RNA small subunit methyltransferase G [Dictyobacter alpinus]|uniref:Ribosomal RNA small subunit methyltransferase G n=1 Tax=Dictyobacter alpinus TaxID=2014873 RepID=A0A402BB04_9CHLR|nr:16S rRNA (guanine(527)-N(7))-methyltransferase RsmG [Dictyobacter alpinus]GCE28472.1 ribosomal RNA small subunit methyltransferase G [Dictyobacter alpinus]
MSEEVSPVFQAGLAQLGLSPQVGEAFVRYRQELLEWNARFNLTAIKDPEEVMLKHFLDSLSLLQVYARPQNVRLLDIGTGPGFPGLPLKIARPDWHVTLIEATGKKTLFLQHMVDVLQLKNVEIIHGRAEEIAHKSAYRGAYDLVTARAVTALAGLLECSAPFCKVGGTILLPKKGDMTDEFTQGKRAASQLGLRLKADTPVTLPGLNDGRRLLHWEQQKPCPPQYPRAWAVLTKNPLG